MRVASVPERGRANEAVLAVLAAALELPPARLELVSGRSSRDKIITVSGLPSDVVDRRLAAAVRG